MNSKLVLYGNFRMASKLFRKYKKLPDGALYMDRIQILPNGN
jgi:hypothetical protein